MSKKPLFTELWSGYPTDSSPCDNPRRKHQCAIRMSLSLNSEGTIKVNDSTYSEPKCTHGHARGAQSLAHWLREKPRLGNPKIYKNAIEGKRDIQSKTGIIFFKNCYFRNDDERVNDKPTGDHFDLWNKGETKTYNDPNNVSSQLWFWELS